MHSHGAEQFLGFFRIPLGPCFHSARDKETVDLIIDHIILPKQSSQNGFQALNSQHNWEITLFVITLFFIDGSFSEWNSS